MKELTVEITRHRWVPLLTGVIAIVLGIWCFCSPVSSVSFLAHLFAILICLAGVFNLFFAYKNYRTYAHWKWPLALGLVDLVAGVWLLCLPDKTLAYAFVLVVGIWLICVSVNAVGETLMLSRRSAGWTAFSVVMLVITIVFAVILLCSPASIAVVGWLYLGLSLLSFGICRVAMYWRLQSVAADANS